MNNSFIIVTHDGQFHADEVASCAILTTLYPNSKIIRTRKRDIIVKSNIVVDVGGEYNHKLRKYDHHQKTFRETFVSTTTIPLSSVGLIYKHYGKEFISRVVDTTKFKSDACFDKFYKKIYFDVIAEIDANDNGLQQYENIITPKYFSNTSVPAVVNKFNQENIYGITQDVAFHEALKYTFTVLTTCISHYYNKFVRFEYEYKFIEKLLDNRYNMSKSGEFIVIDQDCNNWFQCIFEYEKTHPYKTNEKILKFIIYPSDKKWRIRTISDNRKMRLPIKSENELKLKLKHPSNLEFVHKELFIAGAIDVETAIEIANISIE